jgi:hypothetical protein
MKPIEFYKYTSKNDYSSVTIYYNPEMDYFFSEYSGKPSSYFKSQFDILTNMLNNKLKQGYNYRQLIIIYQKDHITIDTVKKSSVSYDNILFCVNENNELYSLKHNCYIPLNDKMLNALNILKEEISFYKNTNIFVEKIPND